MIEIYTLENGIKVIIENIEHYRSVSMGIWVKAGSVNETLETNGIAHVIEHMMFKGTYKRSAKEIADAMTEIGGNVDAYTTKEYTCYYVKTLSEHLDYAIDILGDMLTNSKIDENDLKKELGVIMEEIDMYDDSPEDIVHEQLQKLIWKEHPLGYIISGDKKTVSHFTTVDVRKFMSTYYTGNRMVISISGKVDSDRVVDQLNKTFKKIPKSQVAHDGTNHDIKQATYTPSLYMQHKDIEQLHVIMAYPSIHYQDERKYLLTLVNNLIGGNVNSRLFQTMREELGIAYAIYSYGNSYEKGGLFQIYAAIHPQQLETVLIETIRIIEALKREKISERELYIIKEQIKTELILADESTYNRMSSYGKYYLHHEEPLTLDEIVQRIDAITSEEILDFMKEAFQHENLSLSLVGDISHMDENSVWKMYTKGSVK